MNSMRGFFALVTFAAAAASVLYAIYEVSDGPEGLGSIRALLALLIAAVAIGAAYIGSVIDEHFRRIWPPVVQPQSVQPPPQGYPQQ